MAAFDLRELWIVVPVRGLAAGKSRLAQALDLESRVALNRELLAHTLAVAGKWMGTLRRCIVVSPCSDALELARGAGATCVREGTRAAGLNRAVKMGVAQAMEQGAHRVVVIPGDLPFISVRALAALARAASRCQVVLAPDRRCEGTNALLFDPACRLEPRFGRRSMAAHRDAAARAGLTVGVVLRGDLAFDLDTPADLAIVRSRRRSWEGTRSKPLRRAAVAGGEKRSTMPAQTTFIEGA
jgi:2-phospho-L-lactate guanylyltransferase